MPQIISKWEPKQVNCENCWTRFFHSTADIQYYPPDRGGPFKALGGPGLHYVKCPTCKMEIEIPTKDIPPAYRKGE